MIELFPARFEIQCVKSNNLGAFDALNRADTQPRFATNSALRHSRMRRLQLVMEMAIFHCSLSIISRGAGSSSCAAAAYRAGEKIKDERTGVTHDYTRKGGVMHSEILAPTGSPDWAYNRAELWNHVEQREDQSTRRATATTAREIRLALPSELNLDQQITLTRAFGQHLVKDYGVAVDFSIHAPDREGDHRNFHVHMLISDRRLADTGFAGKLRELSARNGGRAHLVAIRRLWAEMVNQHLAASGRLERVDHRTYQAQSFDLEPTIHLGVAATALERQGVRTVLGNFNRNVAEINSIRVRREPLGAELHVQSVVKMKLGKDGSGVLEPKQADLDQQKASFVKIAHAERIQDAETKARAARELRRALARDHRERADADVKASSAIGVNPDIPSLTNDRRSKADALLKQQMVEQQMATKTPNQSFVKMSHAERIKDAKTKAKAARELRRTLARDQPRLGRCR